MQMMSHITSLHVLAVLSGKKHFLHNNYVRAQLTSRGKKCCAPGCENRWSRGSTLNFYRLPVDLIRRAQWVAAVSGNLQSYVVLIS